MNNVEYDYNNNRVIINGKSFFSSRRLKFCSITFLILSLVFFILFLSSFTTDFYLSILCIFITFLTFSLSRFYFKCRKNLLSPSSQSNSSVSNNSKISSSKYKYKHATLKLPLFDSFTRTETGEKWLAKYKYEDVKICRFDTSFKEIFEYDYVDLIPELSNPHDDKAVAIMFSGNKLGYLYKSSLQNMVYDFLSRDEIIRGQVQKIVNDDIYLRIYFYKKRADILPTQEPFTVKLVGNTNSEMQLNISYCSIGDDIDIDLDYEKNKFQVSCGCSDVIGYIPSSKYDFIDNLLSQNYELTGKISDIVENSKGQFAVKVTIHPE